MADDDPELGKAIERSTGNDAQQVHAGVDTEPVDRGVESALQQRLDQSRRRTVGMQVQGHIEGLGGGEDIPELRIIEIFTQRVRVDYGAFQPEAADAPLQLFGRLRRSLRCDRRESCEAGWVL